MIGKDLDIAKSLLENGEVVAIPTETVYGLAANALNPIGVSKIFKVKNRPSFDPLIIHCADAAAVERYVRQVPPKAARLLDAFAPGALTLLLEKDDRIPEIVTAGLPKVAVRIPNHPLTLELLHRLDFPLAAPSANPFGYISPTSAQHVSDQLGDKIPYILDGGPCSVGVESTIIGFEQEQVVLYRKGGLALEKIEALIGPVQVKAHSTSNPKAPGMLHSHYAPRIPLVLGKLTELLNVHADKRIGLISFSERFAQVPSEYQVVLSETGNMEEAARNLFAGMRRLDAADLDLIVAELIPEQGLGRAINDRLRRAAATPE